MAVKTVYCVHVSIVIVCMR